MACFDSKQYAKGVESAKRSIEISEHSQMRVDFIKAILSKVDFSQFRAACRVNLEFDPQSELIKEFLLYSICMLTKGDAPTLAAAIAAEAHLHMPPEAFPPELLNCCWPSLCNKRGKAKKQPNGLTSTKFSRKKIKHQQRLIPIGFVSIANDISTHSISAVPNWIAP